MKKINKYDSKIVEIKIYKYWLKNNFFLSSCNKKKKSYSIIMPPPNVTGILHVGHMLNNTIQDILIRKYRMEGKETCWVPGTDHASIATEAKVVEMLKKRGIEKKNVSRKNFLKYTWEYKNKYEEIIINQLKKIGCSCDWSKIKFTMDKSISESVNNVFIKLYKEGYIYRKKKIINWDPKGNTTISDDEIIHKKIKSKIYYIKYKIEKSKDYIIIATTRPETIMADSAICINPNDKRYKHFKNKKAIIPIINKSIPIIEDECVNIKFGTGCLKITPAHSFNDYEIGKKYNLECISILDKNGKINKNSPIYKGEDRFIVRKKILEKLKLNNEIEKIKPHESNIGFSERTNEIIEPRISTQWFIKMKEISKPALKNVINNKIKFYPSKFKNLYIKWMDNIKDWCISRQLYWGHRIPAYYLSNGSIIVEKNKKRIEKKKLKQDEDILDTWFSSWIWPIAVFNGINKPKNKKFKYYYPTNDLVTAPEIIFFWVARMIISGYKFTGNPPFKNVYFTGIVKDNNGKKMSKSLGNSPNLIELINKYGSDGIRSGILFSSKEGNDLLFNNKLCIQGRNFSNKIWNTFNLIKIWEKKENSIIKEKFVIIKWFQSEINESIKEIEKDFLKFKISDILIKIYKLTWDEFCSKYIEIIKPKNKKNINKNTYKKTIIFFKKIIKLLHPFMPFITEEIWQNLKLKKEKKSITISNWPKKKKINEKLLKYINLSFKFISKIRMIKNENNISKNEKINIITEKIPNWLKIIIKYIKRICNINIYEYIIKKKKLINFTVEKYLFFLLKINIIEKSKIKSISKIEKMEKLLKIINQKLNNENFIKKAPKALIEKERKKKKDVEYKIKIIKNIN